MPAINSYPSRGPQPCSIDPWALRILQVRGCTARALDVKDCLQGSLEGYLLLTYSEEFVSVWGLLPVHCRGCVQAVLPLLSALFTAASASTSARTTPRWPCSAATNTECTRRCVRGPPPRPPAPVPKPPPRGHSQLPTATAGCGHDLLQAPLIQRVAARQRDGIQQHLPAHHTAPVGVHL